MNISYPKGTWPLQIENFDVKTATKQDAKFIADSVAKHALVVIRGQNLTVDDECRFGELFGNIYTLADEPENLKRSTKRDHPAMSTVTGKLDQYGMPGLHGMNEDLDWHCGSPAIADRPELVYLYAITGSAGSRTTYANTIPSYLDLPEDMKEQLKGVKFVPTRGNNNKITKTFETFGITKSMPNYNYTPEILRKNKFGDTTMLLPFLQIEGLKDFPGNKQEEEEFINKLTAHFLSEPYLYHHDWQDGDIVIHDNWNGLHKRWAFDRMDQRILHRMQYSYEEK